METGYNKFSPPGISLELRGGQEVLTMLNQMHSKLREVEELRRQIAEIPITLSAVQSGCEED